jgi:hypothetical protein
VPPTTKLNYNLNFVKEDIILENAQNGNRVRLHPAGMHTCSFAVHCLSEGGHGPRVARVGQPGSYHMLLTREEGKSAFRGKSNAQLPGLGMVGQKNGTSGQSPEGVVPQALLEDLWQP